MKKSLIFLLVLISLINFVSAGVRINEIMADPSTCPDADCEYIEIYTDNPINLTHWKISTGTNNVSFSFYLEDYLIITKNKTVFLTNFSVDEDKVITLSSISLHNTEQDNIFLYNGSELISSFTYDKTTPGISWQYCENWLERSPTPTALNNCTEYSQEDNTLNQDSKIYPELDWNEADIINGEEFEIELKVYNLEDKAYDIRVWIEDSGAIISDRYDEANEEWKSGTFYINNFFDEEGNKTKEISLRIRDDHSDFVGDAKIFFKIRDETEISKKIEVLEREVNKIPDIEIIDDEENKTATPTVTRGIIKLGNKEENIEEATSNLVYESKNEKMKKYALIGFGGLCLILTILVILRLK